MKPQKNPPCVDYTLDPLADYNLIIDRFNRTGIFGGSPGNSPIGVTVDWGKAVGTNKYAVNIGRLLRFTDSTTGFNYSTVLYKFSIFRDAKFIESGCVYPGNQVAFYYMKKKNAKSGNYTLVFDDYPESKEFDFKI